jgi:hypothetical protein
MILSHFHCLVNQNKRTENHLWILGQNRSPLFMQLALPIFKGIFTVSPLPVL